MSDKAEEEFMRRVRAARGAVAVEAVLVTGDTRRVNLVASRKRWDALQSTLSALPWERLDVVDAKGAILVSIARDGGEEAARPPRAMEGLAHFAALLAANQERTMKMTTAVFSDVLSGYRTMVESQTEALKKVQKLAAQMLDLGRMAGAAGAGDEGDGEDGPSDFDKLMRLMQLTAMMKAQAAASPPPPRPAGVKPPAT